MRTEKHIYDFRDHSPKVTGDIRCIWAVIRCASKGIHWRQTSTNCF